MARPASRSEATTPSAREFKFLFPGGPGSKKPGRSERAASAKHRGERQQQDLEIQGERPLLDVVDIKVGALWILNLAPTGHLPPPRHAGTDAEHDGLPFAVV